MILPFLKYCASEVYSTFPIEDTLIIFPNKRSETTYLYYYQQYYSKISWAPNVTTISDFVQHLSGIKSASNINIIIQLYDLFKQNFKLLNLTIDEFFHLGEIILSDFDELDKYLLDVEKIFNFKKEYDLLENFLVDDEGGELDIVLDRYISNNNRQNKSERKKWFDDLWAVVPLVYNKIKQQSLQNNVSYEGLIYRYVAENLTFLENKLVAKHYVFVGFNALNNAESSIINSISDRFNTKVFWDADNYYLKDYLQESGYFIRKHLKRLHKISVIRPLTKLSEPTKNVHLYSLPNPLSESKLISNLQQLFENIIDNDYSNTAIILANENYLVPLMHSLPAYVTNVNITMGYSCVQTQVYRFINVYLFFQEQILNDSSVIISEQILFSDFVSLYKLLHHSNEEVVNEETAPPLPSSFLEIQNSFETIQDFILSFLKEFESNTNNSIIERETIFYLYRSLKQMKNEILVSNEFISLELGIELIRKILLTIRIPFIGEPLTGLQIMGMLETRNMDFTKVILLNINESNLPKKSKKTSFLGENLKDNLSLPTRKQVDAMYSYYFYRMLHLSDDFHIVYVDSGTAESVGEVSRYVTQMKSELPYKLTYHDLTLSSNIFKRETIFNLSKTENVFNMLSGYLQPGATKYFSPHAIETFLDCTLKFYFKYLTDIAEYDSEETSVLSIVNIGTLLHQTMSLYYKTNLNIEFDKIDELIDSAYSDCKFDVFKDIVDKHLLKAVVKQYVILIVTKDKKLGQFKILGLERFVDYSFPHTNQHIRMGGIIDRIDSIDTSNRIVDYKTGISSRSISNINDLFDTELDKRNKYFLQLMMYVLFLSDANNGVYVPHLYMVKEFSKQKWDTDFLLVSGKEKQVVNEDKLEALMIDFKSKLNEVFDRMYDNNTNFVQTTNEKNCEFCSYNKICLR